MKLSMSMLAWYLREQNPICHIRDDDLRIRGLRFVTDDPDTMLQDYLYFGEGQQFFTAPQSAGAYLAVNCHSMLIFPEADFNSLLNALLSAFSYFAEWEEQLQEAAEQHAPLREIVDLAAPVFGNPLSVGSLDMRFNVGSDLTGHRVDPLWRESSNGMNSVNATQYEPYFDTEGRPVRELSEHPRLVRNVYEGGDPVMMLYLRQDGEPAGYLAILQENTALTQMNLQLAPIFAHYCTHAEELTSDAGSIQSEAGIFQNLLEGRDVGSLNLERLPRLLPPSPWRLLALCVSGRSDHLAARSLLSSLKRQEDCYFPVEHGGVCYCLAAEYRIQILTDLTYMSAIGASTPFTDLSTLPVRRQQAEFALNQSGDKPGLHLCEDYACEYLLRSLRSMDMTAALLHPAMKTLELYDRENHGELRRTLSVYLAQERNQLAAAEALHIHPNSMRYRLGRIREITGLTLDDPEELKYLRLSDWLEC
jgi:hypothetical protein